MSKMSLNYSATLHKPSIEVALYIVVYDIPDILFNI